MPARNRTILHESGCPQVSPLLPQFPSPLPEFDRPQFSKAIVRPHSSTIKLNLCKNPSRTRYPTPIPSVVGNQTAPTSIRINNMPHLPTQRDTPLTYCLTSLCTSGKTQYRSPVTHLSLPLLSLLPTFFSKSRHSSNSLTYILLLQQSTFQATTVTTTLVFIPFILILRSSSPRLKNFRSHALQTRSAHGPEPHKTHTVSHSENLRCNPLLASRIRRSGQLSLTPESKFHWRHREHHD